MTNKPRRDRGDGSITLRKDGRWQAAFYLPDGTRKFVYGQNREEARKKLNQAKKEVEQGILATAAGAARQTVTQYLDYWLTVHRSTIKDTTYVLYGRTLRSHVVPALGHIKLQKLTPDHVQAFYGTMQKEKLSPNMIQLIHTILSTSCKDTSTWKRYSSNPDK